MAGVNPHRNLDSLTRFAVPGKVEAKWGEVRVVRSRRLSIHPDLRLPVDAAEDQPRHLALPIGRDRHLFAIPTRAGISAEKPFGLSLHTQGAELVQWLLFFEALAFVIVQLFLRIEGHALGIPGSGHSNHSLEGDTALEPLFRTAHIKRIQLEFPLTGKIDRRPIRPRFAGRTSSCRLRGPAAHRHEEEPAEDEANVSCFMQDTSIGQWCDDSTPSPPSVCV